MHYNLTKSVDKQISYDHLSWQRSVKKGIFGIRFSRYFEELDNRRKAKKCWELSTENDAKKGKVNY